MVGHAGSLLRWHHRLIMMVIMLVLGRESDDDGGHCLVLQVNYCWMFRPDFRGRRKCWEGYMRSRSITGQFGPIGDSEISVDVWFIVQIFHVQNIRKNYFWEKNYLLFVSCQCISFIDTLDYVIINIIYDIIKNIKWCITEHFIKLSLLNTFLL